MALPDNSELTEAHLVLWELASDEQLSKLDALYEYACTIACTNGLRPLGMVEVERFEYPDLDAGEGFIWGGRTVTAEAAETYAATDYRLCALRLPVQAMGAPVPSGVPVARPSNT